MAINRRTGAGSTSVSLHPLLDAVNRRLLTRLQSDPRMSVAELARQLQMSAPAVRERLDKLEQSGVITGYRVEIDPAALGLPVTAIARVRPSAGQLGRVAELAAAIANVTECQRITGEDCFLLKVHAASVEQLADILDRLQLYGQTVTSVVVSTPVPPRDLPLEESQEPWPSTS